MKESFIFYRDLVKVQDLLALVGSAWVIGITLRKSMWLQSCCTLIGRSGSKYYYYKGEDCCCLVAKLCLTLL